MLIPYLLFLSILINPLRRISKDVDVVILAPSIVYKKAIVPLFENKNYIYLNEYSGSMNIKDVSFVIRAIISFPKVLLHPPFIFNFLKWTSYYSYVITKYNPKHIANLAETIVSASVLTFYLRERGVKHINQMHGERFAFAGISFCEFDKFNVWGDYFMEQFSKYLVDKKTFDIVGNPFHQNLFANYRSANHPRPKNILIVHNHILDLNERFYNALINILKNLDSGWQIFVRYHHFGIKQGNQFFAKLQSENLLINNGIKVILEPSESVNLSDALLKCKIVIGAASTALLEAWVAGCKVIYLEGDLDLNLYKCRYRSSKNVFYCGLDKDINEFILSPINLNSDEDHQVNYVTKII